MPELPEVEVVRRGLAAHIVGRVLSDVQVLHPRAARRHVAGPAELAAALEGGSIGEVSRRGKYLWLTIEPPQQVSSRFAVVVHLGMSGQMLIGPVGETQHRHLRIRATLDDGRELRFVDQRTFGGWMIDDLVPSMAPGDDRQIPASITHIAPDPFDDAYLIDSVIERMCLRHTEIKRALLDQSLVSGIGNIYADEALWLSKIHGQRMTDRLTRPKLRLVLQSAQTVMAQALDQGGTSFDSLYVNVNGESGYFSRSLNAYGRQDLPCPRCGTSVRRQSFMNRSSFFCPRCQRRPR